MFKLLDKMFGDPQQYAERMWDPGAFVLTVITVLPAIFIVGAALLVNS